ncbi:Macrophage colony-stimulating factor 1 receptor [Collariella sp. IMI 366227]|nr:Macrophage colony-stimulating factor 1 receptor [Collariella sp. IMI 366227]
MMQSIEQDDEDSAAFESVAFDLGDVDPSSLSEDFAYSSVLLELPSGLTAFCNPTSLRYVAALLSAMQHTEPDDILDFLQMDAMTGIFDAQKDEKMKGRVNDLLVRLPHINLRLINSPDAESLNQSEEQDQYDLSLTKLSFTTRSHTTWQDAFKPQTIESRHSFHLSLDSAELSAAERVRGMENSQAAALARVDSVLASMGTKDVAYFDVDIGGIHPSVFVSHELRASQTIDSHTIKTAASSQYLSLIVKQDPVTLAEVLDLLVRDEAAMAANFGREIIFDFDIKENSHDMQVKVNNVARSISLLQIPPTNGRIRSHMEPGGHSLSVFASLELVQLDASAVYSLLTALNRPEISNVLSELQDQIKLIQEHILEVTGEQPRAAVVTTEKPATGLAYDAHLTFAGLEVFGNSPLKSEAGPLAHISFALGTVHLGLSNRVEQHGPILEYPEINVNLRRIAFEIQRGSAEAMKSCGNVAFGALISASSRPGEDGKDKRPRIAINDAEATEETDIIDAFLSSITYSFEICNIQMAWLVNKLMEEPSPDKEDLVLSLQRIEFGTRTRNSARLTIEDLQLQMVSPTQEKTLRSPNSALLPEVIFNVAYVSTADARRLAFQAIGKVLDVKITSGFIIPAAHLNDSISLSYKNIQQASENWSPAISSPQPAAATEQEPDMPRKSILGGKRLESLLVDADFAGAVVHLTGKKAPGDLVTATTSARPGSSKQGQPHLNELMSSTTLKSPGLALKLEYTDNGKEDPSLHAEVKIDASSNIIYPSVVPLIVDISNSVKKVVSSRQDKPNKPLAQVQEGAAAGAKLPEEDSILTTDPTAVLGRMKLNLGLRICKQEFSLSCQPIARVAATASFEDVYFTANTVRSIDQGNFFAISGAFTNLQASVQHVYSRESTGSFKVQSIVFSFLNSKHVSGTNGVSVILKVSPMEVSVNAKQLQDFMLFREIWLPRKMADPSAGPVAKLVTETSQGHLVQRYQQVAATAAFPWTASISISALKIVVDLGQALGKSTFSINDFWVSSKKTSDWEQNLCLGFSMIGIESTGRMSGFVALENFKLRTSIEWPEREQALNETPMVQASVSFSQFRVKAAFDYQAFLVADITSLEFLMYNVRRSRDGSGDRLVAILDGEAVQVFGTTTSAAQIVALYQALQRLVQERKANFETSLKEIERYMKRKSVAAPAGVIQRLSIPKSSSDNEGVLKSPISLDTDVVVTLKALNLGVFPSTFSDHQVFKMEALNAQARFAASVEHDGRIHSILGLTLGQLRIGLAGVRAGSGAPKTVHELSVEDVVQSATGSRGGTILKVPQVQAVMQTWQRPEAKRIDYIFKSAFEGKVEVGWNYSRISYIRGMWANHSKTLAQTWGRELPNVTAIRVTGVLPESTASSAAASSATTAAAAPGGDGGGEKDKNGGKKQTNKITAEVKVPLSKYEYVALEPPVIETPQLRDMGEATPPLEWIGLNRDRLPNLTHQIVIVALLELAGGGGGCVFEYFGEQLIPLVFLVSVV